MVFRFTQLWALTLLVLLPVLIMIVRHGGRRRRDALARFAQNTVAVVDSSKRRLKQILSITAIASLIAALAGPAIVKRTSVQPVITGDVVFLLDVSRSMLAADARPNRLERARTVIGDLTARLQGERVALVAFAGTAAVACPLTIDYAYFKQTVSEASPESVTRGGTAIGDAVRFALNTAFDDVYRDNRALVILTDGGDQNSEPENAARQASQVGVRLIVIGVGHYASGAIVPTSPVDPAPFLYHGEEV